MATKFVVSAGCTNEGTILHSQPYAGPTDPQSLADFALEILRQTPYSRSNTAWGLAELDFDGAENAADDDGALYLVADFDAECFEDCEGECACEAPDYWVSCDPA